MQSYRLGFLERNDDVDLAREFEAENDKAAIKISERWREGHRMELWQRDRKVEASN